jgi:hypothetical protein
LGFRETYSNDLLLDEIETVQELFETNNNLGAWARKEFDSNYIKRCYMDGDLPPNGKKENYTIQTIKDKISNIIISICSALKNYNGYLKIKLNTCCAQ